MTSEYQRTQKKILLFMTGLTVTGFLLYLICVCTTYWNNYTIPDNYHDSKLGGIWLRRHSGLFVICNVVKVNNSENASAEEVDLCHTRHSSPSTGPQRGYDKAILDYYQSQSAFAVISLFLMVVSHIFVVYSLRQTRYMFKRIVGCFHIMSAACVLVVAELNINAVEYEKTKLSILPPATIVSFGFSFIASWLTFAVYVMSALAFIVCSRKKKHHKVPDEVIEQNEPIRLGRL